MMSNSSNPLAITLPVSWSEDIDPELERQLAVLDAQSLALRWERFMHHMFKAWTSDIDAVSFRFYSLSDGLELDISMPDRMYPVGPNGRVEGMAPPASKPSTVRDVNRQVLNQSSDKRALRRNLYESLVVQPFQRELAIALDGQSFPAHWVRKVLDCCPSSPPRTKEEWKERSQAMVEELVGHYRAAARLEASVQPAPVRRPLRV